MRKKAYEEHSNPLDRFIKEYCLLEVNAEIAFEDFYEKFIDFLKTQGYRLQSKQEVGRSLQGLNYEKKVRAVKNNYGELGTKLFILGIKWND